jgi:sarcosine oxidase subunit beta
MTRTADVIIIGGGVIGCSIAYHLVRSGCRNVIIIEMEAIGSGSTGKCPGGIRQQFSSETNIKLSMESVNFFEHFEEETSHPADFHQCGYLILATTTEELEAFRENINLQRRLGVEVDLISPEDAREILPQLNIEDIVGAAYSPGDGYADPYSVVQGFASAARQMGAMIHQETEVTGVKIKGDKIEGVLTAGGAFEVPVVIDAAGAYAGQIGKMINLDIPVRPSRRHLFVTAPLDGIPEDIPMVVDFQNGFWFRREGPGLIFGMRDPDEPEGFDTSVNWGFLADSLSQAACHRLPLLGDVGIARGQAGLHSDTPDYHAIIGPAPEIEGFYLACGFSGHGFMHSPAVGRLMAEIILTGKSDLDISPLLPGRFKTKTYAREACFI